MIDNDEFHAISAFQFPVNLHLSLKIVIRFYLFY